MSPVAGMGTGGRACLVVAALLAALVLVTGCGSPPDAAPSEIASPFAACPVSLGDAAETGPSPGSETSTGPGTSTESETGGGAGRPLPAVSLPCFTGGDQVTLSKLGRPAVINFWASYCQPCRKELPELQRFADASEGRVLVVGVITADTRTAAAAAGEDFEVRLASVFDADGALQRAWGRSALPVTLFVDAEGRVRHEDLSGALTQQRLADLTARYLGVTS